VFVSRHNGRTWCFCRFRSRRWRTSMAQPGDPARSTSAVGCGRSERAASSFSRTGTFCAVHDGGTFNVRGQSGGRARSRTVASPLAGAGGARFIFATATAGTIQRRDRIRTLPLTRRLVVPFSSPLRKAPFSLPPSWPIRRSGARYDYVFHRVRRRNMRTVRIKERNVSLVPSWTERLIRAV